MYCIISALHVKPQQAADAAAAADVDTLSRRRCSQAVSEVLTDADISAAPTTSPAATVHLTTTTVTHISNQRCADLHADMSADGSASFLEHLRTDVDASLKLLIAHT